MNLVSLDDVRAAAASIAGVAVRTPLLSCSWDERLLLKPESLQPVGAFKIRGAVHAVASLSPGLRSRGVITHSSGNHGRALAYAASAAGVGCVVVVPEGTVPVKVDAIRALGAEVIPVPPARRLAEAERLAAERGMTLIPPFDHRDVIAGQGTVGLEIIEDAPDVDVVLVPVGGGGLAAGVTAAVKALRPSTAVIGVEPELAADAHASLTSGHLTPWPLELTSRTVADGLRANSLSELTFAHLVAHLDGIVRVSEAEILECMGRLGRDARLVVEPSGAVAAAARMFHADELPAGQTVAVVTGGNVDPSLLVQVLGDRRGGGG